MIIGIVMLIIDIILLFEIMSHKKRNYIYLESSKFIFLGALIALAIFVYKAFTEIKVGINIDTFKFIVNAIFLIELMIMMSFSLSEEIEIFGVKILIISDITCVGSGCSVYSNKCRVESMLVVQVGRRLIDINNSFRLNNPKKN